MAESAESFRLGIDAFKSGDLDAAVEQLEATTHSDHQNHKAFTYLGAAYAAKGRYNAAIGAFKTAEQLKPGIASIHYNIAQAYEAADVPNEAEYEYERALEIDPNYTKAQEAMDKLKKRLHHV